MFLTAFEVSHPDAILEDHPGSEDPVRTDPSDVLGDIGLDVGFPNSLAGGVVGRYKHVAHDVGCGEGSFASSDPMST